MSRTRRLPARGALRHVVLYGAVCALLALAAAAIELSPSMLHAPLALPLLAAATLFAALGLWTGYQLATAARAPTFTRNEDAARALGLSPREIDVLDRLAAGAPNKVIARQLGISPNTVKTHLAKVFAKLDAGTRTQAIARARELDLVA